MSLRLRALQCARVGYSVDEGEIGRRLALLTCPQNDCNVCNGRVIGGHSGVTNIKSEFLFIIC